ncbi:WecB/TagA/CpsF family glycosyltransferase [Butyrivibrio sp. INlla21]|uniref:WecB/TagA/CpsF family glycosyltransferase n=1 Tax=Butyrivibrio sp. INlla21 TaxID=1520811 RepID=UPI0008E8B202|nr:WecB/TagA/CpsF family glycosyltransferase [Butyrivibrio sp. INlla21]SFU90158.1 polymer biosynthesis protein, WecB/TagA/CpsF family [Butyrivibrio sp. INlla21]
MNTYKKQNFPVKRIFILDEIALILAMITALAIRYRGQFFVAHTFFDGLYVKMTITVCIFHVIIFLIYDNKKEHVFVQDPVQNLMTVIKGKCILMALSLLYLYAFKISVQASRPVIGLFFAFAIIYSFVFRFIYRKRYLDTHNGLGDRKVLTVSAKDADVEKITASFGEGKYDDVLIKDVAGNEANAKDIAMKAEELGIRTYYGISSGDYDVKAGIITDIDDHASIPAFVRNERFEVFGVKYAIARTEEAVFHVLGHLKELSGKYICFSNVHTAVMARENADYKNVLNESAYTFADGAPIANLQRKEGYIGADRVAGPDFMEHMFRDTAEGQASHYFYGASQKTLDALKEKLLEKYPGIDIRGMYSPPFRALSPEEDAEDVERINASGADIVWIGLGAPKQEKWMLTHKDKVKGVMMGVGAGFDFHAGTIKRAPVWIQKIGFEWLYRLFQDPKRLFSRYFVTNTKFFCYLFSGALKRR